MNTYYQRSTEETIQQLHTSLTGLKKEAVPAIQKEFGENVLKETKPKSKWVILLGQFKDVMILILIIAAVISFVAGEHTDAFVIVAIILGNALMGYSQENSAEESVRMLKKMVARNALVIRDGKPEKLQAVYLVPGDLIVLEAGDIVPADARLLEISSFNTHEASLTGESHAIEKQTEAIIGENLVPGDQHNMIFKGTIVSSGSAKAIVTSIGMLTELGKIAGMMEEGSQKTPLQKRLGVFAKQLAIIVILICLIVFVFGLWRGEPAFQMFLTALSLAVAALPEALPAVITIALARGAHRMVKQKALMRNLPAVETLGSVTYICSDKTGTLTQNIMTLEKQEVSGESKALFNEAMLLNNEVRIAENKELLGDSTETALVKYALGAGFSKEEAEKKFPLVEKLPFDATRMRMSTLHQDGDHWILFVKGAPVKMAEIYSAEHKATAEQWLIKNREWASEGLRVLFFGYKIFDTKPDKLTVENEQDINPLGITAMIDPPRPEIEEAIRQCKSAGIKTVMITGDQPLTATAIASRLGMIQEGSNAAKTGSDLEKLSEEEFKVATKTTLVYARVSPQQKLNIVKSLQANGEFVAMTGDGVNDAPSLKQADIGVAMGITGTDVSKEAADMILLDDNFATIVKAIKEGRRIYANIKKFILYVLSCNLGEILTIFFAPIIGLAIPLLPIHILWINLVTDGLPGLALVAEPAEKGIMNHPPRHPKENLFAGKLIPKILVTGLIMAVAAIFIQWWTAAQGYEVSIQRTAVFTLLCFIQLGNALSVRSMHHSIFSRDWMVNKGMWGAILLTVLLQLSIVYIPALQSIFKTSTLNGEVMKMILGLTLAGILFIESLKLVFRPTYHRDEAVVLPEKQV